MSVTTELIPTTIIQPPPPGLIASHEVPNKQTHTVQLINESNQEAAVLIEINKPGEDPVFITVYVPRKGSYPFGPVTLKGNTFITWTTAVAPNPMKLIGTVSQTFHL